jgi:exo-beta-1,3-glucanase (GH17 family)/cellulose synthase/poly-beta-1,6-N-acetylglucosamine synthase-like glycosyltransferase
MKLSSLLIAAVFAALTLGLWAYLNKPSIEPEWPRRGVYGMAFSPFRSGQDPAQRILPSPAEIDADLRLLSEASVNAVRTYSSLGTLAEIPRLAQKHNLKVSVGAWLDRQHDVNRLEVDAAIRLGNQFPNVIRLFIGNEVILRGDLTVAELGAELDRVREATAQPVSTAEPWHVWITHPELARHVDFIGVHLLPYWEGIHVDRAVDFVVERMQLLAKTFPDKPIVIAEVGWPSDGRIREFAAVSRGFETSTEQSGRFDDRLRASAIASVSNQAMFLRRFLQRAQQEGYVYYIMEAFDQPWKARYEGSVGAYWGVYDVNRRAKFAFFEPIVRIPQWHILAGISVTLAALLLGFFYAHSGALGTRGSSLLAIVVYATATGAVWVVYEYSQRYLTLTSLAIGTFLMVAMLTVIAVLIAEAHEWAEARWSKLRRRPFVVGPLTSCPMVSIHVPAHAEPPQMVIETLDALARLEYPDYEVLVVDNNTRDESLWRPVAEHCAKLGPRFRFFHVGQLAGFKAGALNYALRETSAKASIVAVIDSDYKVEPSWLGDLIPALVDPKVAIVQAPQDYRDEEESAFKAMCYAEYRGFFHIGMITRNERNAIIQHGTMTLVRRTALDDVGGWAEWCITEDAELGLRVFEHGHEALYLPRSYGRGLMPETFVDYKRQRFRWAYGAMQILRRHAGALFSWRDRRLTPGQRYHFVAGWLPWVADGLNLIFTFAALAWSVAMIVAPHRIDPPLIMFSALPVCLFTFKLVKLAHLYVSRLGANLRQTFAAALAGLALSYTIGVAILKGAVTRSEPFYRTPKLTGRHALLRGLAGARQETALLAALLAAAWGLTREFAVTSTLTFGIPDELKAPDLSVWIAVLLIQAIPYAAALLVSLISALRIPASILGRTPAGSSRTVATRQEA